VFATLLRLTAAGVGGIGVPPHWPTCKNESPTLRTSNGGEGVKTLPSAFSTSPPCLAAAEAKADGGEVVRVGERRPLLIGAAFFHTLRRKPA